MVILAYRLCVGDTGSDCDLFEYEIASVAIQQIGADISTNDEKINIPVAIVIARSSARWRDDYDLWRVRHIDEPVCVSDPG